MSKGGIELDVEPGDLPRVSVLKIQLSPPILAVILPQQKVLGGDFFNKVCGHLKLLEKEYFGLEFRHHNGNYVRTPDARGGRVEALRGGGLKTVFVAAGVVGAAEAARQAD